MIGGTPFCPTLSVDSAICFVPYLYKKHTNPAGAHQTAQTDHDFRLYLHFCIIDLRLWPFARLNSSLVNASDVGDALFRFSWTLSHLRLFLSSVVSASALSFIPHSPPLCAVQIPSCLFPLFLSLSLSPSLSGAGGLLQTAVGGQDQSRQQEGETGFVWGAQRTTGWLILSFMFSFYIYLAHALTVAQRAIEGNVFQQKSRKDILNWCILSESLKGSKVHGFIEITSSVGCKLCKSLSMVISSLRACPACSLWFLINGISRNLTGRDRRKFKKC